jgi:predicted kinase
MNYTLGNFYRSKEWCSFRELLINERINENGEVICARCGKPIYKRYDIIGHHVTELTEDNVNDASVSLNPDNVVLIHFGCHNKEHQRYDGFRQYVYLVYGAPCSGKTTYVQQNAFDDDLILDLDRIWESICKQDRYHKPNRLKPVAFAIRDTILQQIKMRSGMWRNAYIIGGYPLRSDRDRLCELLRATPIYIEASKDECLARAPSDEWKEFVEDWFDTFTE